MRYHRLSRGADGAKAPEQPTVGNPKAHHKTAAANSSLLQLWSLTSLPSTMRLRFERRPDSSEQYEAALEVPSYFRARP